MSNEWKRYIGVGVFVFGCIGAGCQHHAERSPEAAASEPSMAATANTTPMATEPDERERQKSSVIYPRLGMSDAHRPASGFRPEVLLVTVEREPLDDGSLEIPVRKFKDVLRVNPCTSSRVCKQLRDRFGEQYAVWNHHACTGTFISPNEIITAEHCFRQGDWSRTYAIMGFYADHDWPIADATGIMTVPPGHAIRLCHVTSCEEKKSKTAICNEHGCDLALVHVCPEVPPDIPEFRSLPSTDEPSTIGLEVYSHAWGLPLKRYEVDADSKSSHAMFTNSGGGSGSAMVNCNGEVIGVTSGTVPKLMNAHCPGKAMWCEGQAMTWHKDIRRILNTPTCPSLAKISGNHQVTCPGRNDAPNDQ